MVAYQWSSRSPELPGARTEDRYAWHVLVSAMVVPHQNKAFKHRFRLSHGSPRHAHGPSHAYTPCDSFSRRQLPPSRWDRPTDSRLHTSPARRSRPPRTAPLARARAGRRRGSANARGALCVSSPGRRDFCRPRAGDPRKSNALYPARSMSSTRRIASSTSQDASASLIGAPFATQSPTAFCAAITVEWLRRPK